MEKDPSCKPLEDSFLKTFRTHSPLKEVRYIIAVGSGKGGVGKTTVSVLLSLALKEEGFSVGLYDLDFYGPNSSLLLSTKKEFPAREPDGYRPPLLEGIKVMSLSFMLSEREPVFMRGLMAAKLLQELTQRVLWGPLDFLILDLPPGTGDIFLSMLDLFSPDGFILVTTPHKLSLADSLRTVSILKEKKVPLLGVVKNMSNLFGKEEAFTKFLEEIKAPLLFELPFLEDLSEKETLPELLSDEEKKGLLQGLAKGILKRIFRFH
ncbi:MAG: Mrp/NBP35 family ATP-binding protein [Caldimicrobium sp.]